MLSTYFCTFKCISENQRTTSTIHLSLGSHGNEWPFHFRRCLRHLEGVAERVRLSSRFGFRAATDLPAHRIAPHALFAPTLNILARDWSELLGTRVFTGRENVREAERGNREEEIYAEWGGGLHHFSCLNYRSKGKSGDGCRRVKWESERRGVASESLTTSFFVSDRRIASCR